MTDIFYSNLFSLHPSFPLLSSIISFSTPLSLLLPTFLFLSHSHTLFFLLCLFIHIHPSLEILHSLSLKTSSSFVSYILPLVLFPCLSIDSPSFTLLVSFSTPSRKRLGYNAIFILKKINALHQSFSFCHIFCRKIYFFLPFLTSVEVKGLLIYSTDGKVVKFRPCTLDWRRQVPTGGLLQKHFPSGFYILHLHSFGNG